MEGKIRNIQLLMDNEYNESQERVSQCLASRIAELKQLIEQNNQKLEIRKRKCLEVLSKKALLRMGV